MGIPQPATSGPDRLTARNNTTGTTMPTAPTTGGAARKRRGALPTSSSRFTSSAATRKDRATQCRRSGSRTNAPGDAEGCPPQRLVRDLPGRVGPRHRDRRSGDEQDAGGLGGEQVAPGPAGHQGGGSVAEDASRHRSPGISTSMPTRLPGSPPATVRGRPRPHSRRARSQRTAGQAPMAALARSSISSGATSSTWDATVQRCPYGSSNRPERSP